MKITLEPCQATNYHEEVALLLTNSFFQFTGKSLIQVKDSLELGRILYEAPMVVLAHDTSDDPVFFYGNLRAQEVFEMSWSELIQLPSRFSAETPNQATRKHFLDEVAKKGFIDHYSGTRISKTGRRFQIENATVWNLINSQGLYMGQAACFKEILTL